MATVTVSEEPGHTRRAMRSGPGSRPLTGLRMLSARSCRGAPSCPRPALQAGFCHIVFSDPCCYPHPPAPPLCPAESPSPSKGKIVSWFIRFFLSISPWIQTAEGSEPQDEAWWATESTPRCKLNDSGACRARREGANVK